VSHLDTLLGFTIPGHHARGRLVRLGPLLNEVLSAHGYPQPIEKVLAEALALTALLGSTLKDDAGQMTLQAQTESGVIDLLVCDYKAGELRGYVQFDAERLAEVPADPTLFALFGKGYLAITFDQAVSRERYQGIVPLEGASLAEAAQSYFSQSEQIPTLVKLAVAQGGPEGCRVGGMLLQHLPEGEEGRERLHTRLDHPEWEHVRMLGETVSKDELIDPALDLETLVWRLFNEEDEVRLLDRKHLAKGCRCDPVRIAEVIARFPEDERQAMAGDDGVIRVDCEFCARSFPVEFAEAGTR
jgi:molecular chaperone Hsp33